MCTIDHLGLRSMMFSPHCTSYIFHIPEWSSSLLHSTGSDSNELQTRYWALEYHSLWQLNFAIRRIVLTREGILRYEEDLNCWREPYVYVSVLSSTLSQIYTMTYLYEKTLFSKNKRTIILFILQNFLDN